MNVSKKTIERAVLHHLPDRKIMDINDRGEWIRHNFRIILDEDEIIHLKIDTNFPASVKEAYICELLTENDLPAPPVIALDTTSEIIPAPYIIQKHLGGIKLEKLIRQESKTEQEAIYFALGKFYKRLHNIKNLYSGWIDGSGVVLPKQPNEHQYDEVIVKIGQEAVDIGVLTLKNHERLKHVWAKNMEWLNDHTPSLVSGALRWAVYLLPKNGEWEVSKIMDLADMLYWDPAWDLASIRYPAFGEELKSEIWDSFQTGYGNVLSEERMKIYLLMQRLDSAMGNYLEPETPKNKRWKDGVWRSFGQLIEEVYDFQG